jgi:ABC-2 type transport system ATP-binding protein
MAVMGDDERDGAGGLVVRGTGIGVRAGEEWLFRALDLELAAGQCLALTGVNGTGKSTLLRCLYGAQPVDEGDLRVAGTVPDERAVDFRHEVSVLLDDSTVFDELSPRQHLELLLRSYPDATVPGDLAADLLAPAGLGGRVDVPAGVLSAGQRRRLLLLGAVARPHRLLLLDEPERALDSDGRDWLAGLVLDACAAGAAVVLASHHRPLVDAVADLVLELG